MYTRKLYDEKPYETTFEAKVVSIKEYKNKTDIILDQTLFFPEEGGQSCDQGLLNNHEVIDVQILDHMIVHTVKGHTDLKEGMNVHGSIDWTLRFNNMQNHSGEHILSGIVHKLYGYDNVGFHLGLDEVTVDFNGVLEEEDIIKVERLVNEAIYKNVKITTYYPYPSLLKDMDYRSKLDLTEDVRIVEIEGYDLCACCAPHVRYTGEIGLLKIVRCDHYKKGVRLSILAGRRAFAYLANETKLTGTLYRLLSANRDTLVHHVERIMNENTQLKYKLTAMETAHFEEKISDLKGQENAFFFVDEMEPKVQQDMVNKIVDQIDGFGGIFVGTQGYRYIIASRNKDSRTLITLIKELGGKGGGKAEMIRGFIPADEASIKTKLGL